MAISKRIFGSDIPLKVKQKLAIRQSLNKSADFGEAIDSARSIYPPGENEENIQDSDYGTNFGGIADLSSRTPFARLWTSVKLYKGEKTDETGELKYESIDKSIKTYIIGNHIYNNSSESESPTDQTQPIELSELLPSELENNEFLKPPAGITSITSATEGTLGVIKKTTINFTVNNFTDYDKIYSRFFLKPGAQLFVDFGWDTSDLYNPQHLIDKGWTEMGFGEYQPTSFDDALYGDNGFVTRAAGDMETLVGFVTNYDAKIKDNGTVECSVEITSKNAALLNNDLESNGNILARVEDDLDNSILDYALKRDKNRANHIMNSWTKGAQSKKDFEKEADDYGHSSLYKEMLVPTGIAVEHGVFWVGGISAGAPIRKQIYISYGVFEDFILNPEFGFGKDKYKINTSDDAVRFDSGNSFVTYDEDVFNYQKSPDIPERHILYPDNWDNSYSRGIGKEPDRGVSKEAVSELDIGVGRIPLREVFINTTTIKNAFSSYKDGGNILDVLKDLFEKIKDDTFNSIDLKLSNNGNSSIVSPVDINTLDIETNEEEENDNFKKLFIFKPNSPNSIVKTFDVSFSMPSGNIGNMIAIQSVSSTKTIFPITEFLDDALALESFDTVNTIDVEDGQVTERISIGYQPEIGSYRTEKLSEDIERDGYIGFNFGNTFDKLIMTPAEYKEYQNKLNKTNANIIGGESDKSMTLEDGGSDDTKKQTDKATSDDINADYVTKEVKDGYKVMETIPTFNEAVTKNKKNMSLSNKRNSSVLPLTLNLGIYGISSITPGDVFKVDYLPQRYINTVYFQVMKVSHNLDSSGWTTNFETQFRLRKNAKIKAGLSSKIKGVTLNRKILKKDKDLYNIDSILTRINRLRWIVPYGEAEEKLTGIFQFISKKGLDNPEKIILPFYIGTIPGGADKIKLKSGMTIYEMWNISTETYKKLKEFSGDLIEYEEVSANWYKTSESIQAKGEIKLLKITITPKLKKDIVYKLIHKGQYWFIIPSSEKDNYEFLVELLNAPFQYLDSFFSPIYDTSLSTSEPTDDPCTPPEMGWCDPLDMECLGQGGDIKPLECYE